MGGGEGDKTMHKRKEGKDDEDKRMRTKEEEEGG